MRHRLAVVLVCLLGVSSLAIADHKTPPNYFAVMGSYTSPDSAREADYGGGFQLLFGQTLSEHWRLEYGFFASVVTHETDDEHDFQYALGLDLAYAWNTDGGVSPFVLLGGGLIYDDVRREEETSPFIEAGAGIVIPLHSSGAGLRAEGRYVVDFNDETVPGESNLSDARANIGVQIPLSRSTAVATSKISDLDNDGVADRFDKCPGTPPGVPVGPDGCEKDSDGDGVPDSRDKCPNTPKGLEVDLNGCARDSDGDGCIDAKDLCPDTGPGMKVGPDGCAIAQVTVLKGVNFEFDSAQLTPQAKQILNGVARTLRGQPDATVNIDGHTDSRGSDIYNLNLSRDRAHAVRLYLIRQGVRSFRMNARGFGESRPVASNSTDSGRAQNRRVELEIL